MAVTVTQGTTRDGKPVQVGDVVSINAVVTAVSGGQAAYVSNGAGLQNGGPTTTLAVTLLYSGGTVDVQAGDVGAGKQNL